MKHTEYPNIREKHAEIIRDAIFKKDKASYVNDPFAIALVKSIADITVILERHLNRTFIGRDSGKVGPEYFMLGVEWRGGCGDNAHVQFEGTDGFYIMPIGISFSIVHCQSRVAVFEQLMDSILDPLIRKEKQRQYASQVKEAIRSIESDRLQNRQLEHEQPKQVITQCNDFMESVLVSLLQKREEWSELLTSEFEDTAIKSSKYSLLDREPFPKYGIEKYGTFHWISTDRAVLFSALHLLCKRKVIRFGENGKETKSNVRKYFDTVANLKVWNVNTTSLADNYCAAIASIIDSPLEAEVLAFAEYLKAVLNAK